MSDLIVARFDDAHTAFLARAALARLQEELSLPGKDLAVVTREAGGKIALQETVGVSDDREICSTYWRKLSDLLFARGPYAGAAGEAVSDKLAAVGIDATFGARLAEQLQPGTSALLVLVTRPSTRDKLLGVLHGFQGKILRTELTSDDLQVGGSTLPGTKQPEEMQ